VLVVLAATLVAVFVALGRMPGRIARRGGRYGACLPPAVPLPRGGIRRAMRAIMRQVWSNQALQMHP
jgi:hypothetical protein